MPLADSPRVASRAVPGRRDAHHTANERLFISPRLSCMRGDGPLLKQTEDTMSELTNEVRQLDIEQLDRVSGGDIAIDLAVKAYEALGKRLLDAVHQPVTQPTTLHF